MTGHILSCDVICEWISADLLPELIPRVGSFLSPIFGLLYTVTVLMCFLLYFDTKRRILDLA